MADFLLEIGTEDMPFHHVRDALPPLSSAIRKILEESKISFEEIKEIGTLRRLAIYVKNIALEEIPEEEVIIGPPLQIALNKEGKPTEALLGFLKAKNANLNDIEYLDTDKGTYVCIKKIKEAKSTEEIFQEKLPDAILSLCFPKTIRWGGTIRFARPIRNLLCLLDGKIVNFSLGNISSSNFTFGHRIWGKDKIQISLPEEYLPKLRENYVVVEPEERKNIILREMEKIEERVSGKAEYDRETLDYWVYSVEFPYIFLGTFNEEHLSLPQEIIGYVIGKSQKFFPILSEEGNYLPFFIGIADSADDLKGYILKGAERVINARLIDARFFWEKDRETPFEARWQDLSKLIYHEKLGTYLDKSQRITALAEHLAEKVFIQDKDSIRMASQYCKVDLVTEMVKEFPALQGIMGGIYLKEEGYPESVWRAVYEHYKPLSLDDHPPSTIEGAIISICDKLDHVVGAFVAGIEFSGSSDPFALRKAGLGLCKTILYHKMSISINDLVEASIKNFMDIFTEDPITLKEKVLSFLDERLEFIFQDWMKYRLDLVRAVFASGAENIHHLYLKLKAIDAIKETPLLKALVFAHKRIKNIIAGQPFAVINQSLFTQKQERELWEIYKEFERDAERFYKDENFEAILELILQIEPFVNKFFDNVLVMVEDMEVRKNRLALLSAINSLILILADFSQIISS